MTGRYQLIHVPSGHVAAIVMRAESWWAKGWGVLGRQSLPCGEGLWLPGVASIHTLGVRFSLDLLFLSGDFTCLRQAAQLPPGCWNSRAAGAFHTLELGAGTLAQRVPTARVGDRWMLERLPEVAC